MANDSRIIVGLPQFPENVPQELFNSFFTVYTAIHNLARSLSLYAGVDPVPEAEQSQVTVDDTIQDGNLNRWYAKANEIISFGAAVSPILVGSELQVRLANATNASRWCCGFVNSIGTFSAGQYVEIRTRGLITGVAGMISGDRYWLSTTNGVIQNAAPAGAGNIVQVLGFALSPTRLLSNPSFYFPTV
jgi:hypothetical protein